MNEANPNSPKHAIKIATIAKNQREEIRVALAEFTKVFAFAKTEKDDDAQVMIARCYKSLGESEEALSAYQKLREEYPESEYIPAARKEIERLRGK